MSPFIFKVPIQGFIEKFILSASDGLANDKFGDKVVIEGNVAVIAASAADIGGLADQGSVYVFEFDGSVWNEVQKLIASDGDANDNFGISVGISGSTIVVGANGNNAGGFSNLGAAYIYEKAGTWPVSETKKITASDQATVDQFGTSVAISGSTIVVGAPGAGALSDSGNGYIFEKAASWPSTETAMIFASDAGSSDGLGFSAAIDGDTIVLGTYLNDPSGVLDAGAAYIYEKAASWPSTETQKLTASDKSASSRFAWSVSISGTTVVVGAFNTDPSGVSAAGSAYVYDKAGTWPATETVKITASDKAASDQFGLSVSVNNTTIVVGSASSDPGGVGAAGSVYIYEKEVTWPIIETKKIIASNGAALDNFGISVGVSGTTIVAGAYRANPSGVSDAGVAYIFAK